MLLVLLVLALLTGCLYPNIPAAYQPPATKMLIVVDDPKGVLGDPSLLRRVGNQVRYDLIENLVVPEVVPFRELDRLQQQLGKDFAKTPLLTLGEKTGAQQVLHITVLSAQINSEPGMLRPQAVLEVRLIDVENAQRLWPTSGRTASGRHQPFTLRSEMFYRTSKQAGVRGQTQEITQRFATLIGRDIAKLFYEHEQEVGGSYHRNN